MEALQSAKELPPVSASSYGLPSFLSGETPAGEPALSLGQRAFSSMALNAPWQRGLFVGVATGAVLYTLQPASMFDRFGARPWTALLDAETTEEADNPTTVPWWLVAAVSGVGATLFL